MSYHEGDITKGEEIRKAEETLRRARGDSFDLGSDEGKAWITQVIELIKQG